jgi:hypothetical protein
MSATGQIATDIHDELAATSEGEEATNGNQEEGQGRLEVGEEESEETEETEDEVEEDLDDNFEDETVDENDEEEDEDA